MKENLEIFKNDEFNIRVVRNEQGEPLFCAKDVCDALGYNNSRDAMRKHVEIDDVAKRDTMDALGRMQPTTFINESGLYSLILSSKLESAKRFKHWVTSEVLPSIRKHGGYIVTMDDEPDEEIIARALQLTHNILQKREKEIALLRPKAEYAEEVLLSEGCYTAREVAKGLGMTAQKLNKLLCEQKIQYYTGQQYVLYAKYDGMGYSKQRTYPYTNSKGEKQGNTQLVWTEKGRLFIHTLVNKLRKNTEPDLFTMDNNTMTLNIDTYISYEEII